MIKSLLLIAFSLFIISGSDAETLAFSNYMIKRHILDCGVTLIVKPERSTGIVAITAMAKVGAAQESIKNPGIGRFVSNMLLASTEPRAAETIAAGIEYLGGNVVTDWRPDFIEIRAITTSDKFNKALALICECLNSANFETKWVEKVRSNLLDSLKNQPDNAIQEILTKLRSILYEDNGYKRPFSGDERTFKTITVNHLKSFYSSYFVPNNFVISIVGDISEAQAIDRAKKAFAGMNPKKLPIDRGVPNETLQSNKKAYIRSNSSCVYLVLGWLAPSALSEDYYAALVAANALGGGKGSFMFREIREKHGIGYDLGVIFPRLKYQSYIAAYIQTDISNRKNNWTAGETIENARHILLDQVNKLKNSPLTDTELNRAKGYTIGQYELGKQRLMDRAVELASLEAIGVGYLEYNDFASKINSVTPQEVQNAAIKYFTNYAEVISLPQQ